MGLTTAMYTGLSGLNVNQFRIDTIGNNISNVNTTAYKGSRTVFQTQFSQTLSAGTPPSDTSGGTNPTQVGLGALVGATQRNFSPGSIETTGIPSDMAIDGNGFFIVRTAAGRQVYTRDGAFSLNANNQLVTQDGHYLRGFGVDAGYNIVPNILTDLSVPLGTQSVARQTENVRLDGDLSAAGTISTRGSESATQALVAGGGGAAGAGTALTDLRAASDPGVTLFSAGNTITVSGVTKGQREIEPASFVIGTDGNTLGDFAAWLEQRLGIQTGAGIPGTPPPGVSVAGGQLVVRGNAGEQNNLVFDSSDIRSDNATITNPFQFTQNANADGSGVFTAFTVYDSLGTPVRVNATFALESTNNSGPVWRYYLESPDGSGATRALGTGTVSFDNQGRFVGANGTQFTIDRSGTGAATPLGFTLNLEAIDGLSTQTSNVILGEQDGYPPGTLTAYSVGNDGIITGAFSNGQLRTLGQVAVATFANPEGLVAESDNLFSLGPNAGPATITAPNTLNAGAILSGALELSNVDLAREFVGLITSSTGFQASSRVITVANDLLNQLLLIAR